MIGHVEIERSGGVKNDRLSAVEVTGVRPAIVVVEKAEIWGFCLCGAKVARIAAPMPVGPWDEGERTNAAGVNGAQYGVYIRADARLWSRR